MPPNLGDITKIDDATWSKFAGEIDILTGGFPCQPFSGMQGTARGEDDPRYVVVDHMIRGISRVMPRYILLENVAKLYTTHKRTFLYILDMIESLGYRSSISIGNPKEIGYLQSRTRIYIALSRNDCDMWILPKRLRGGTISQSFREDSCWDTNTNCFEINPKRVKRVFGRGYYKDFFACLCAESIDSHCSRFTWIHSGWSRDENDNVIDMHRSPTVDEMLQLFGYPQSIIDMYRCRQHQKKYRLSRGGVSRTAIAHAFGNSWHVGHASYLIAQCPL